MSFLNRINTAKTSAMPSGAEAAAALRDYARDAGTRIAELPEPQAVRTGAALAVDGVLQDLLPELDACGPAPISHDLDQRALKACRLIDSVMDLLTPDDET